MLEGQVKGTHKIGDGFRSLLLSENSAQYAYSRLDAAVWRFKYFAMLSLLNDVKNHEPGLGLQHSFAAVGSKRFLGQTVGGGMEAQEGFLQLHLASLLRSDLGPGVYGKGATAKQRASTAQRRMDPQERGNNRR